MDNYTIKLYTRAHRDLSNIYTYIADDLLEPGTAQAMLDTLEEAIYSLEQFPERNPLRQVGFYSNRGCRQMIVKKYAIIYRVINPKREVHVMTIRYAPSQF